MAVWGLEIETSGTTGDNEILLPDLFNSMNIPKEYQMLYDVC